MQVAFRMIRDFPELAEILRADGWDVEETASGTVLATHPAVGDEQAARLRLQPLGLLTTGAARLEFRPVARARRARHGP